MGVIPYHYFSSDKLVCITSNKVASRYLGDVFIKELEVDIELNRDFSYKDTMLESCNTNKKISAEEWSVIKKDFDDVFSKKTTKDILILYRNPFKRVLTGLIQNFYSDLFISLHGNSYDFKLKKILKEFPSGINLYDKLSVGCNFPTDYDKFTADEQKILNKLCIDYIFDAPATSILHTSHTNSYITYLYTVLKDDLFDNNKVYLIDIDDSKNVLTKFLKKYVDFDIEQSNSERDKSSNKPFVDLFLRTDSFETIDDEDREKILNCIYKIKSIVSDETFFYDKIKKLPQNITK